MSELPLVTVLALAALVLVLGLRGDSSSATLAAKGDSGPYPSTQDLALARPAGAAAMDGVSERFGLAPVMSGAERSALASPDGGQPGTEPGRVHAPLQPTPDSDVAVDRSTRVRGDGEHGFDDLSGLREEGRFHRGVRHGEWITRYEDGSVHERGEYSEGLRDGLWQTFSVSGSLLMEAGFAEGQQHGVWRLYGNGGELVGEGSYEENHRSGRWTLRYTNGSVKERGRYENGLREGLWEFFDDLGRPTVRSGTYRAGIRVD